MISSEGEQWGRYNFTRYIYTLHIIIELDYGILWDNLQENTIFHGKFHGFRLRFSRENQAIDMSYIP